MPRRDTRRDARRDARRKPSQGHLPGLLLAGVSMAAVVLLLVASHQLGDVERRLGDFKHRAEESRLAKLLGHLAQDQGGARQAPQWSPASPSTAEGLLVSPGTAAAEPPLHAGAAEPKAPATAPAAALASAGSAAASIGAGESKITWKKHSGKTCHDYADGDSLGRSLADSQSACLKNQACAAIECPHGGQQQCTLRAMVDLEEYAHSDCYEMLEMSPTGQLLTVKVHPKYDELLKEYPFQRVTNQNGQLVNIILVRSHMSPHQCKLYSKYKDDILFIGISSMNDYPLNPEGKTCPGHSDYVSLFPGFLHMMREPEKEFPPHVKTLLMSQSDFNLPKFPKRDYSVPRKYDFTYSGSDCDVHSDCTGWCGWSKNWSFVKEALKVMCNEPYNLKGVLVATKDKAGKKACTIPQECKGKMTQTTYLANQQDYYTYLKQSRFAFLPQIHDASPRVSTQALALDVPILMNYYIMGGWKYVTEKTGEFFHDIGDFRKSLDRILLGADTPGTYEPQEWVLSNYDNPNSGKRLYEFVKEHFSDRVRLPKNTKMLFV